MPALTTRQELQAFLNDLEARYPDLFDDPRVPAELAGLQNGWEELDVLFTESDRLLYRTPEALANSVGSFTRYFKGEPKPRESLHAQLTDEDRRDLTQWLTAMAGLAESARALLHYDCFVPVFPKAPESFSFRAYNLVELLATGSQAALLLENHSDAASLATLCLHLATKIHGEPIIGTRLALWSMRQSAAGAILDVTGDPGRNRIDLVEAAIARFETRVRLTHHTLWREELSYGARLARQLLKTSDDPAGTAEDMLEDLEDALMALRVCDGHLQHRTTASLHLVDVATAHFAALDEHYEANGWTLSDVYSRFASSTCVGDVHEQQALVALHLRHLDLLRAESGEQSTEAGLARLKAQGHFTGFNIVERPDGYIVSLTTKHPLNPHWTSPMFIERVTTP